MARRQYEIMLAVTEARYQHTSDLYWSRQRDREQSAAMWSETLTGRVDWFDPRTGHTYYLENDHHQPCSWVNVRTGQVVGTRTYSPPDGLQNWQRVRRVPTLPREQQ
jgi:hypothetical protein